MPVVATTAAPVIVNPATAATPTGIATGRYGVGVVPLGSLLMGGMGLGTAGLARMMMPRVLIGR